MPDDHKTTHKSPPRADALDAEERPTSSRTAPDWTDEEASTRTTEATIAMPAPRAPRPTTSALLTVVGGPNVGRVFSVRDGEMSIGRGRDANVRIDDAGASRAHARTITADGGRYFLEDLKSTNGTFVAGRRITRVELSSGDRIHIGPNIILSFAILDAQAEKLQHQLYESSVRDPLTRAHNRRYLFERLASEIAYARRHRSRLALIMFDIDHFKRVNDTHGHLAGDDVLRELSALVTRLIRAEDVFASFGGEEFVVLVRGISHAHVGLFSERLRSSVESLEVRSEQATLRTTISVGFASLEELPEAERASDGLLRLADERLYQAKTAGRNRVSG